MCKKDKHEHLHGEVTHSHGDPEHTHKATGTPMNMSTMKNIILMNIRNPSS